MIEAAALCNADAAEDSLLKVSATYYIGLQPPPYRVAAYAA